MIGTHLWELRRDGSVRKSGELGCPGIRFASTSLTLDTQDTAMVAAVVNTAAIDHCMIGGVRHDLQITDRVIVAADATLSPRWIARVKGQVSKPWGSKIVVASSGTGDVFVAGAGERSGVTIGPKVIMPATSGRDPRLWIAGLSGATGEFLWAQTGHGKNAAGTPLGSFTAALVGHAGHGWLLSYYSKKIILAGTELVAPSPSCGDFLPLHGAIASFDAKLGSLSLLRPSADTPDSGCRPATTALAATPEGPCVAGAIRAAHVVGGVSIPMAGTNTAENPHELFAACFDATAQKARWTFHLGTTIPEKSVALRTGQNGRLYLSAEIDQPIHVAGQTLWAPTGQPSFLLIVFDASSGTIVDALVIPGLPAAQTAFDVDRDGAITLATRLLQPTTLGGRRIVPHVRGTLVIWRITSGH
ncbi:MAG: hypothetical protein KAI47_11360 [Deltaproteobacteria bacterium]|nr:hypothetical protein [Deltaproteobacteria bacterium]